MNVPSRPLLRYYGGKWKIADWVVSFFPEHRLYLEPFGGAASVLLKKKPARVEVYNDLSDEMVNLFRVLRDPELTRKLVELLHLTPYSRTETLACYDFVDDPVEQARRTVVLASTSHNPAKAFKRMKNGFRTSTSGYHRLPQDFIGVAENLFSIADRMKGVIIENRDAIDLIKQHDSTDALIYCDPPYVGELRSDNGNFYQHEMRSLEDHYRLAETLNSVKGMAIVSGYDCPEYDEMYTAKGWHKEGITTVTGAAMKGKSNRIEVLWLSPKVAALKRQQKLFPL